MYRNRIIRVREWQWTKGTAPIRKRQGWIRSNKCTLRPQEPINTKWRSRCQKQHTKPLFLYHHHHRLIQRNKGTLKKVFYSTRHETSQAIPSPTNQYYSTPMPLRYNQLYSTRINQIHCITTRSYTNQSRIQRIPTRSYQNP